MNVMSVMCYFALGVLSYFLFKDPLKEAYRKMYSKEKMRVKFNALATYIHSLNKEGKFDACYTGTYKGYDCFNVEDDKLLCCVSPLGHYLYAVETIGESKYIKKYVQWKVVGDDVIIPSYEDYYYIRKFDKNFRFIFKIER